MGAGSLWGEVSSISKQKKHCTLWTCTHFPFRICKVCHTHLYLYVKIEICMHSASNGSQWEEASHHKSTLNYCHGNGSRHKNDLTWAANKQRVNSRYKFLTSMKDNSATLLLCTYASLSHKSYPAPHYDRIGNLRSLPSANETSGSGLFFLLLWTPTLTIFFIHHFPGKSHSRLCLYKKGRGIKDSLVKQWGPIGRITR